MTPRVEKILARAADVARGYGHSYVGTEHVLIALASDEHGIAGQVLERLGVREQARAEADRIIRSEGYNSIEDLTP